MKHRIPYLGYSREPRPEMSVRKFRNGDTCVYRAPKDCNHAKLNVTFSMIEYGVLVDKKIMWLILDLGTKVRKIKFQEWMFECSKMITTTEGAFIVMPYSKRSFMAVGKLKAKALELKEEMEDGLPDEIV